MTCLQITLPVPGTGPAMLTLPQPLTPRALLDLEHAVAGTLGMLRRDLLNESFGAAPEHIVRLPDGVEPGAVEPGAAKPDAAAIEYASWMPDAGAIEVASWAAHMQSALR